MRNEALFGGMKHYLENTPITEQKATNLTAETLFSGPLSRNRQTNY